MKQCDKNYILKVLRSQTDEWKREPRLGLPRGVFEHRSYYNFGISEALRDIRENKTPPITTIKIFIHKMRTYANKNYLNKDMFIASVEAGEDILELLNAMTLEEEE